MSGEKICCEICGEMKPRALLMRVSKSDERISCLACANASQQSIFNAIFHPEGRGTNIVGKPRDMKRKKKAKT
jgi:hypothetical protein